MHIVQMLLELFNRHFAIARIGLEEHDWPNVVVLVARRLG